MQIYRAQPGIMAYNKWGRSWIGNKFVSYAKVSDIGYIKTNNQPNIDPLIFLFCWTCQGKSGNWQWVMTGFVELPMTCPVSAKHRKVKCVIYPTKELG